MDFEFTDDQLGLREAARAVLGTACPSALVRAVHEGTGDGGALWRTLVEHDWPAVGLPEDVGGLGLGYLEVGILVEELGRVAAPSPYLATVTQLVPALREAGATSLLGDVASGAVTGSLALAEDGRWELDAVATPPRRLSSLSWPATSPASGCSWCRRRPSGAPPPSSSTPRCRRAPSPCRACPWRGIGC